MLRYQWAVMIICCLKLNCELLFLRPDADAIFFIA
jgi:hypothetical protein